MLDLVHVGHELARERAFREVVFDGVLSLDFLPLFALFCLSCPYSPFSDPAPTQLVEGCDLRRF